MEGRSDLERMKRMILKSRQSVEPSKIQSISEINTSQENDLFNRTVKDVTRKTNTVTGETTTISRLDKSNPRKNKLAQKILGNKDVFIEHADKVDADGNLIMESDRQIKNFGLNRNKSKVKYHDKQAKQDSKAMEKLFKKDPDFFNYQA